MKSKIFLALRCLSFLLGLFIMGCGIATITNTNLGTTPITSIPYAVNSIFPLTIGTYTALMNATFVLVERFVLGKKRFKIRNVLQILPVFFFALCIDFWMHHTSFVLDLSYIERLGFLGLGIVIMAVGILIEVASNIIVLPGEGLVLAIAYVTRKNFGSIKVICDTTMVAIGMTIGLVGLGSVVGVGEGTICSAILTGFVVRFLSACVRKVFPQKQQKRRKRPRPS